MTHLKTKLIAAVIALMISVPTGVFAQGDPGDGGCDPLDPACPIDGGLSLLLAAGIGLGARKAYKAHKEKRDTVEM
ncbi:MAG: hypothetical protein JSR00_07540 [Bacteroidetes bacterium]|nr:hypothetical protein [Bacteroidota bacterium]